MNLKFLTLRVFASLACCAVSVLSAQDPDELVSARLFSDTGVIKAGDSALLVVEVEVEEGWHLYWKSPGATGLPTEITWTAGQGMEIGPVLYPVPYYYESEGSASYALKGKFLLIAELQWSPEEKPFPGKISVLASLSGLVCSETGCFPYGKEMSLDIPTGVKTELVAGLRERISASEANRPVDPPEGSSVSMVVRDRIIGIEFQSPLLRELDLDQFNFFPVGDFFDHSFRPTFKLNEKGNLTATLWKSDDAEGAVGAVEGVLTHPDLDRGWKVLLEIEEASYGEATEGLGDLSLSVPKETAGQSFRSLWLMLSIVLVAMAVWVYGKNHSPGRSPNSRLFVKCLALGLLLFGVWLGDPREEKEKEKDSIDWKTWTPELEQSLLAEGKGVYIDFTARWCLSCQVNKRVYEDEEVIEDFKEAGVVFLYADWTDKEAVILEALQGFDRGGVPLNVYYPPARAEEPIVFPEILSPDMLLEVLETEEAYWETEGQGFWAIVGFAFLGGMILNLMPCVFPVLGLKIMAFVKQAGEDRAKITNHGLVFTLGVLLSFWLLVGVLLFLRERLEQDLGWGFQLQEPLFVFVLALFLLVFAMSLSGVFEIGLSLTGVGSKLSQGSGYAGSFFSGVLATVVATPCMAPFLGVAVGAALSMDLLPAFAVFTSVALGLASPYLTLSLFPSWVSKLPKPGAWMDTFKQAMAFPLYATVAWLIWTLQGLL